MKKSIFKKYFALTAVIIFISFTVFGAVLIGFSRNLWLKDKNKLLVDNVHAIADMSADSVGTWNFRDNLGRTVGTISKIIGEDIFICDDKGNMIVYNVALKDNLKKSNTISQAIVTSVMADKDDEYKEMGTLGGVYNKSYYIVAVPLVVNGQSIGAVFAAVPVASLLTYLGEILRMVLISALLAIILSFMAVYIATMKLTKPLLAMAEASKRMAKGDFLTRITVSSQDEVGELATAFNNMTQSLASLEQMRRSFISNVSHELKTPMTTIAGFIDGILDGTISEINEKRYLMIVSEEVKRLSRLVNSMLVLAKLEQGETSIKLTEFNITDTVVRALLSFEQKIDEKEIEIKGIEHADTIKLFADIDLIHQVVYNLIDNAIKFTPQKGTIEISVENRNSDAAVIIKNSGEGISARELSNIFERFYKTDRSRGVDKTGLGLGLYIVKTIIDIHGGKIIARSIEGEYTEFEFIIPKGLGQHERI